MVRQFQRCRLPRSPDYAKEMKLVVPYILQNRSGPIKAILLTSCKVHNYIRPIIFFMSHQMCRHLNYFEIRNRSTCFGEVDLMFRFQF